MIHLFGKKKKLLWFPVAWANSLASWCLGICSPNGTISIKNTATPKEGGTSLELDINEDKVAALIAREILRKSELTETEQRLVKMLVCGLIDQKYITYRNDLIGLDMERLKQELEQDNDDESEEVSTPFELSVEINSGGTAVTEVDVFLPSLKFTYGGVEYDVETGTGTGYVTQVETGSKWYCIRGVGAGDLWLVDNSTSSANKMHFTQTAPNEGTVCIYIGKVSIVEVEGKKVGDGKQFYSPKRGEVDFGGGGGGSGVTSTYIPQASNGSQGKIGSNSKAARADHTHPLCESVSSAVTAANNAVQTANSANTKATNAATAARSAQETADGAVEAIGIVEGNLETLTTTVTTLSGTVTSLSGTVDSILNSLEEIVNIMIAQLDSDIKQAQADAEQALQDAADAQSAAEGAQTDATDAQTRVGTIEADYLTSDDLTNLITKNEIPQAFINAISSTCQGTVEIGGRVSWDGTKISQPVRTLTLTAGLITGISSPTTATIPTVQYSN